MVGPGAVGLCVVKVNVEVPGQPPVPFRLVGPEVVQHYVELCVWIVSDDAVHEVRELPASTASATRRYGMRWLMSGRGLE